MIRLLSLRRGLLDDFVASAAVALLGVGCSGSSSAPQQTAPQSAGSSAIPALPNPSQVSAVPPRPGTASAGTPTSLPGAESAIPAWAGKRPDEPFKVKEYLESRSAPADNAAPLYFAALADLSPEMDIVYSPADWQARLPQIKALSDSIGNLADEDKLLADSVSLQEVERVLTAARPAFQKIDQAQQKTNCVFVTGLHFDSLLPHAQSARQIARLAQLQLYFSGKKGDFDESEKAIRRTLRLSRDLRPRGVLISQLVSVAIDAVVLSSIQNFTLRQPGLKPQQCDRLLALLAEHEKAAIDPNSEGLRMEYVMQRNTLDDLQTGRVSLDKITEDANAARLLRAGSVNWEGELTSCSRVYADALVVAARPYHEVLRLDSVKKNLDLLKTQNVVVVRLLMPALDQFHEAVARDRARLACMQGLIAVRRNVLAHGTPPADLEIAVREAGLASVPTDPYSGQPIRFKVLNGKPIVYSVGRDQKDDGGAIDWNFGKQPGDFIFQVPD